MLVYWRILFDLKWFVWYPNPATSVAVLIDDPVAMTKMRRCDGLEKVNSSETRPHFGYSVRQIFGALSHVSVKYPQIYPHLLRRIPTCCHWCWLSCP